MLRKLLLLVTMSLFAVQAFAADTINGAGASFPFPIYSTWAFDYAKATKTRVNYQSVGSGAGIQQITENTVAFGATDDPIKKADLDKNGFMQFPAVVGGIVPVVNVDGVKSGELVLTGKLLADIYHGKITKWNDPAIAAINKGMKLPNANISVIYRSDSSGTSAVFTTYLSQVSQEWNDEIGAGKSVKWAVGMGAKGNDGVAGNVKRLKNSIGYVEYAYAKQNNISWTSLVNKAGKTVAPTMETFQAAAGSAAWDKEQGYYLWLVNADGDRSWPIAAATFILLRKDQPEVNAKVVKFFDWCFKNGDTQATNLIYVALPESLKESIRGYWRENGIKF
ncbi:MAG: phosphate ABC transporter substrate-binding protein PstS [Deferribacteraceae bacterium]|jgi:phosphate transport system substrate-binding protein|nr:phosphate ABC transporter substrate-binding protein PstS [Deferribacteraceae bacterium]